MVPFTPMRGLLKLGAPDRIIRGIIDLFFVKMMGRNLAQRMIGEGYIKVRTMDVVDKASLDGVSRVERTLK
jgi:hypothetical protein